VSFLWLELGVFEFAVQVLGELYSIADQICWLEMVQEAAKLQVAWVFVAKAVDCGAYERLIVVEEPGQFGWDYTCGAMEACLVHVC